MYSGMPQVYSLKKRNVLYGFSLHSYRLERMIEQMKATEGITEALKASDPMTWVQRMNNIRARAEEIVRKELVFV